MQPRWVPWLVLAAGALCSWVRQDGDPVDYSLFAHAGNEIWAGHLAAVYSDPTVQAGPLQLALASALYSLARVRAGLDVDVVFLGGGAAMVGVLLLLTGSVRRAKGLAPAPRLVLTLCLAAMLWGWVGQQNVLAHTAEFVVPTLWVSAGLALFRRRPWLAGLLLGISTGWEIWGLLGFPLLLLALDRRRALRAVVAVVAVQLVLWVPFVAAGHFEMLTYKWPLVRGTPVSFLVGGHFFDSGMRTLQLGASLAAAAGVALLLRRSVDGVWLVPLTAVLVRLWLDPVQFGYYWVPVVLLVATGCAAFGRFRAGEAVAFAVALYVQFLALDGFCRTESLAVTTVLLVAQLVRSRRTLTALTPTGTVGYVDGVDRSAHDADGQTAGADRGPGPGRTGDGPARPAGARRGVGVPSF